MRELFPGFYDRTDQELSECWKEGIFVFDTNMLLNVYRYAPETRNRYFEILDILKKRNQVWIPYQAAYEYQNRRVEVIYKQLDPYTKIADILRTTSQTLDSALEPYKNKHGFIDATPFAEELTSSIKKVQEEIKVDDKYKEYKKENQVLKKQDKFLKKLEEIFQGNIGRAYASSKLEEIYKRAQFRLELKVPPGWEDRGKKDFHAYGDIILWFQLLDYARVKKKPIVFVTDDSKKDWWLLNSKGDPMKPLPELTQEVSVEAGVLFHMYLGYEFLSQAEHFLKLEEKPEAVENAKVVTEQNTFQNTLEDLISMLDTGRKYAKSFNAEKAVYKWFITQYPEVKTADAPRDIGYDFFYLSLDGESTPVEVKYTKNIFYPIDIRRILKALLPRAVYSDFKRVEIFLVHEYQEKAHDTLVRLQNVTIDGLLKDVQDYLEVQFLVSITVGYLDKEGNFIVIGKLSKEEQT